MAGETTTKPTTAAPSTGAATTSSTAASGSAATGSLPNGPAKPAAEVKRDALDTAMDNYDKVYKRFGDPEKAKAFLEAIGKEKSPLVEQENRSAVSAARAREMSKEQSHDMTFADRSGRELGLPERPPGYGAAYMSHDWEIASIDGADNPAELLPDTWKIIVSGNRLLHGYVLQPNGLLARARFPAFTLKTSTDGVPHFEVFDDSSIQIKETSSTREKSMAANGFSSSAIQASVSGGFGGWSASASAARATESQRSSSSGDFQDHKEYTACYSFPRALVYIDEQNIDISPECKKELRGLSDAARDVDQDKSQPKKADLIRNAMNLRERFFIRFGHVFVTKFLLGGQLTASKTADSFGNTADASIRDSMKLSAAISVESKFVSGSVSGSKEKSTASQAHQSMVDSASSLAWSARGGNTLLAASPSEWANSVGGFRTWRPLEQDKVIDLVDLITRVTDENEQLIWSSINQTFKIIDDNHYIPQAVAAPTGPVKWDRRFRLEAPDGRMLKWDGTVMCLSDNANASDATVFRAVDADDKNRANPKPDMEEFRADWPLFLPTADWGQKYSRENAFRDQIPGLWVNGDGQIRREVSLQDSREIPLPDATRKICRWSFRLTSDRIDYERSWNPNNRRVIADGAKVNMYCHSYFCGSYRTTDKPPYFAAGVFGKENSKELKVMRFGSDQLRWLKWPTTQTAYWDSQKIPFLQNDSGTVQGYMEQFDRGVGYEPNDVTSKLEDYRNIMAFNNDTVAKPFLDASAARNPSLFPNRLDDQLAQSSYKKYVVPLVQQTMDDWKNETKFTKEMTFTVRYFR